MGNCLSKKISVEQTLRNDISELISKGAEIRPDNSSASVDMKKSLKEDDGSWDKLTPEASKQHVAASTVDLGDDPVFVKPAVAFIVEMDDTNVRLKAKMPKRLVERIAAQKAPKSELEYTNEEECLMADIMREETLKGVKEKAVQEEIKVYDAQRRRMVLEKSKDAKQKSRSSIPTTATNARQRVKEMAQEDRMRAAERRNLHSSSPMTREADRQRAAEHRKYSLVSTTMA